MRSVLEGGMLALVLLAGACDSGEGPGDDGVGTESEAEDTGTTGGADDTGGTDDGQGTEDGTGDGDDTSTDDSGGEASFIPGRPCPPDAFVTADNFGMPVMLSYCNGCHSAGLPEAMRQGAPVGIDFDSVEDVRVHAERIYARSADENQTMPPVGSLSEEERLWLGDWLACGAP